MDSFQFYYQWGLDYLQQIEKLSSEEKPHLAENFNGYDPDILDKLQVTTGNIGRALISPASRGDITRILTLN